MAATTQVITCTLRKLQMKLNEKYNTYVSLGTIMRFMPFYTTYGSDRETVLYMCMLCHNLRHLFNVVMDHGKKQ